MRKEISNQHHAKVISSQPLPMEIREGRGKSQTIHTWSDRASNYFVSGEDDIQARIISGDTISNKVYT